MGYPCEPLPTSLPLHGMGVRRACFCWCCPFALQTTGPSPTGFRSGSGAPCREASWGQLCNPSPPSWVCAPLLKVNCSLPPLGLCGHLHPCPLSPGRLCKDTGPGFLRGAWLLPTPHPCMDGPKALPAFCRVLPHALHFPFLSALRTRRRDLGEAVSCPRSRQARMWVPVCLPPEPPAPHSRPVLPDSRVYLALT